MLKLFKSKKVNILLLLTLIVVLGPPLIYKVATSTTSSQAAYSCTDSDGGKEYNTYGYVLTDDPNSSGNIKDKCLTQFTGNSYKSVSLNNACSTSEGTCFVEEVYCDSSRSYGYSYDYYECTNGCQDGACLSTTANINEGDLFKINGQQVIYHLNNGKRDVIPYLSGFEDYQNAILSSWGWQLEDVIIEAQSIVESYPLGQNKTIKAGDIYRLKKQSEEKYYIVTSEATLSEVNKNDYSSYNQVVIPDAYIANYTIGESLYLPDFYIYDITYIGDYNGDSYVFSVDVCNNGGSYTFGSEGLKVEFGLNGSYINWVRNNGGETMNNGTCREFFPGIKLISSDGTYNISTRIDGENQITESDESNNTFNKEITTTSSNSNPDFIISDINISKSTSDNLYYIYTTVENIGERAEPVMYSIIDVKIEDLDTGDIYTGLFSGDYINGYTREVQSKEQLVIYNDGQYRLKATVDSIDKMRETNENNNTLTETIKVSSICTESWSCGSWSTCTNSTQTRTCTDVNSCGTTSSKPALSQGCADTCSESWSCGGWSACINGLKTKTCTDRNNCGTTNSRPSLNQSCIETATSTKPDLKINDPNEDIKIKEISTKELQRNPESGEKFYIQPLISFGSNDAIADTLPINTTFLLDLYLNDVYKERKTFTKLCLNCTGITLDNNNLFQLSINEAGQHTIKIVIDPENIIDESNENNNSSTKTITIQGLSDEDKGDNNDDDSDSDNNDTNRLVLQLQRKITELERQVIDLEIKLTILNQEFADKYAGIMFLDVENYGRLWYVDPSSKNRFYFENGEAALSIGSKLAIGITYEDIQKIPVGIPNKLYNLKDSDGDGLPDRLESALGSDPNNTDTDGDGLSDKQELENGYDPVIDKKFIYNQSLINRLKGKMLLQVSGPNSHGEIWYIHNGKRWYGGTQDSMYEIMKARSLGAIPEDIRKIVVGEVEGIE
jgi:hypothetical protein